jgi:hypothetical protein
VKRDFKVWFPGDRDTEDDAIVMRCFDAEDAANEACQARHCGPDHYDEIDGDPILVMVRDGATNAVTVWDVWATASVDYSAEQVEDETSDAPHVVTTAMPFGLRCLRCGATKGLTLPISVDELCVASEAFTGVHRECKGPVA